MNARLLVDVWHDVADPWSRIGLDRLLRGIDLARTGHSLPTAGNGPLDTGNGLLHGQRREARGSASNAPLDLPEIVIDVHSFLSPGAVLPEANAEGVTAVAAREGIPVAKEKLRHPPSEHLRRLAHRVVHAAREGAQGPADGARRALEAAIRLDDWFLGLDNASGSEAHAGDASEPSPRMLGRIAGLAPSAMSALERRLELGEWEAAVDRDIVDAKRLRIRGLPLTVIGARVMLVGAQSPRVFAEAILEAAAALSEGEHPPKARRFSL